MSDTGRRLAQLSQWIDDANRAETDLAGEALTFLRVAKVAEEAGETVAALIGATGTNPRKGMTHTWDDVCTELLDVAVTALAAWEHCQFNEGGSDLALARHVAALCERAGLPPIGRNAS